MVARELRIGNLVWLTDKKKVWEVSAHDIEEIDGNPEGAEGIPLTKEWLAKFGLELKRKHYSLNLGRELSEYVEFPKTRFCLWYGGGFGWTLDEIIRNETSKSIKYVHELQNLYFALTQEELILK